MRDEVADVACFCRLVDEVAVAERDFQFAERVSRIAGLDDLAGLDALSLADPGAGRRYPCRVPDDLGSFTVADIDARCARG
jgi:hypothetical protein